MRTFFFLTFITLLSCSLLVSEASARRFGGGRSFGVQRSQSSLSKPFSQQNAAPSSASAAQKANPSRWGGILGGLLVGGLLASLFMGNGLFTGLLTWLALGVVILLAVNFFRRRMQPGYQSASHQQQSFRQDAPFNQFTRAHTSDSSNSNFSDSPPQFNAEDFLRDAKITFIRLQAAYDEKNTTDLQEFTAPEVFAEIKMQLDERGNEPNKTEVINLNAELLDVSKQSLSNIASVRFTGSLRENGETISLNEIWHFRQFVNSNTWVIGGIQQDVVQP